MHLHRKGHDGHLQDEHSTMATHESCVAKSAKSLRPRLRRRAWQVERRHRAMFRQNQLGLASEERLQDPRTAVKRADLFDSCQQVDTLQPIHSNILSE